MKKILYQLKNHIKYLFKRNIISFDLLHCERLMEGGYANKKTYDMVFKRYRNNFPSLEKWHIPKSISILSSEDEKED